MRKIVIPTDFSENALNALRYAAEFFKYELSEFYVIHAYADEVYNENALYARALFDEVKFNIKKHTEEDLQKLHDTIKTLFPNPRHTFKMMASFGSLVDEVNDIVDKENIDAVVMGTHGKTDDRSRTFGSNTLQVIKYVKCPVLSVPSDYKYTQPKQILFSTNFMLPYKHRELKLLATACKSYRSVVHLLYVSKSKKLSIRQEDNKSFLKHCLPEIEVAYHIVDSDDLTQSINDFVEQNDIQLLVMVNSRHSYLEDILYRSTIDKLELEIKIPFLVMQNLKRY